MSKNTAKRKKLLIFDLDGTLYSFKQGSFGKSDLKKEILIRAKTFIKTKLKNKNGETEKILQEIVSEYGEHISVGLEKKYGVNRFEYFNSVWNINPKDLVKPAPSLNSFLSRLIDKGCNIVIVSDAPKIWITNVLKYLNIIDLFEGKIFSGESDNRKAFANIFNNLIKKLNYQPKDCIVVGDQEKTDIIPAKEAGCLAIFINNQKESKFADYSIKSVLDLKKVLNF